MFSGAARTGHGESRSNFVQLIVCLSASPPVPHDGLVSAKRHRHGNRRSGIADAALSSASGSAIKESRLREGLPLKRTLPGIDLVTGLHPPDKSVPNEKRILRSDASRASMRIGRYKWTLRAR